MKRTFSVTAFVVGLVGSTAFGQFNASFNPLQKSTFGSTSTNDKNPVSTKGDDEKTTYDGHWAGFDFGFNALMSAPFERNFANNPYWENNIGFSTQFNFNVYEYKIPFFRQFLGLTTGLGVSVSSYSFRNDNTNYTLQFNSDTTFCGEFKPTIFYNDTVDGRLRSNTLSLGYFTIPLLFEFATKEREKKSFYFAAGVVGGIRFSSSYFQSGRFENGSRFSNTTRAKYNTNLFTLEATVRTGYSWGGIFLSYNLNTLFKENKTIALYPFRAGLVFNVDYTSSEDSDVLIEEIPEY
jgi:hypothetical protein